MIIDYTHRGVSVLTASDFDRLIVRLLAALRAENEGLKDELLEAGSKWSDEEHQRACAAIQASESLPANHYPSFQERVWWRAAMQAKGAAEAEARALRKALGEAARCANEDIPVGGRIIADWFALAQATPKEPR